MTKKIRLINNSLLQKNAFKIGLSFLLLIIISSNIYASDKKTIFDTNEEPCVEDVQFTLPGNFMAPFEFLNNIPELGLDIDDNGSIDIIPPCSCRLELPVPNGSNSNAGVFDNQLIIATGISGQHWVLSLSVNVLNPTFLQPFPMNTPIPEIGNTGIYVLPFAHHETELYQALVEETSAPGQLFGPVADQCFYPDPYIANLGDFYCDDEENIILLGLTTSPFDENNLPIFGTETWTITRQETGQTFYTAIFSPADLGEGTYTVRLTFDLGTTAFTAANKTGCSRTVETEVIVRHAYPMVCNNQISVTLNPNTCEAVIAPGHLLAAQPDTDDAFTINIFSSTGVDLGNTITAEYVGQTLTGFITDECSGIFCSTIITIFDFTSPEISIPADTTITCLGSWIPETTGFATGMDCTDVTIDYSDLWQDDECGDPRVEIIRTWQATDLSGNQSSATQHIFIARGTVEQMRFPADVDYECSEWLADPSIVNPDIAGRPTLVEEPLCGLIYTYADDTINLCGINFNNFLILRTWTVLDACGTVIFQTDGAGNDNLQLIRVLDTTAPQITSPNLTLSADVPPQMSGSGNCRSMGFIPPPTVVDECGNFSIKIYSPLGEVVYTNGVDGTDGGTIPAPGLPLGSFTIAYEVTDDCGNVGFEEVAVDVIDDLPPIMICDDNLTVNLQDSGFGLIRVLDIDEGSRDDCCFDQILIKLENEPDSLFRTQIEFFCTNATVDVITRAWDCAGNFNTCIATVTVNDLLPPEVVQTVEDTVLTCQQDYAAFLQADFGAPIFSDNCGFTVSFEVEENLNSCNVGTLTRTWTAMDIPINSPAVVTQVINLQGIHDYRINLPADEILQCSADVLTEVTFTEEACDMLTVNLVQDTIIDEESGACVLIQRNFNVINWCEYDGQSATFELPRLTGNMSTPMPATAYTVYSDGLNVYQEVFVDSIDLNIGVSIGNYTYVQMVSVFDDESPHFESNTPTTSFCVPDTSIQCEAEIVYYFLVTDNCVMNPDIAYSFSLDGAEYVDDNFGSLMDLGNGNYQISGNYPLGQHSFFITYADDCGNSSGSIAEFEIIDCTPPVFECPDSLNLQVELGEVSLLTLDGLFSNVIENCGNTSFSFSENELIDSLYFDCENMGDTLLTIWAMTNLEIRMPVP